MTVPSLVRGLSLAVTGVLVLPGLVACEHLAMPGMASTEPASPLAPPAPSTNTAGERVAAVDWQRVADHEAMLLTERFEEPLSLALTESFRDSSRTAFEKAYGEFFLGGLIDRGYKLFSADEGYPLEYDVMVLTPDMPDSDVVVTTRIHAEGQLLYSHTSVYQLSTHRRGLYEGAASFSVRGPAQW